MASSPHVQETRHALSRHRYNTRQRPPCCRHVECGSSSWQPSRCLSCSSSTAPAPSTAATPATSKTFTTRRSTPWRTGHASAAAAPRTSSRPPARAWCPLTATRTATLTSTTPASAPARKTASRPPSKRPRKRPTRRPACVPTRPATSLASAARRTGRSRSPRARAPSPAARLLPARM